MPSRLAFGSRMNARARLLALFRVMARLSCINTLAVGLLDAAEASRRSVATKDCADDGRGAAGVCAGGAYAPLLLPFFPGAAPALERAASPLLPSRHASRNRSRERESPRRRSPRP